MARHLPPALLVVVAILQIGLARATTLTPWKGGGFGMFSTLDHGAFRGVHIIVEAPERSEALEVPSSLETAAARAANFPSVWLLRELAEGIVARERRNARAVSRVRLTVWRAEFQLGTLHSSEHTIRQYVYDVPAEP